MGDLDFRDLIIETYRPASVTTAPPNYCAVRVIHKRSGKSAVCDKFTSQIENRAMAINILRDDLGMHDLTVALDFDGVLHGYSKKWQDGSIYDPPVDGAVEALRKIADEYELIIFTCRTPAADVKAWIKKHFDLDIEVTNEKPHADMYIDDRGYYFDGDWPKALKELERRREKDFSRWC